MTPILISIGTFFSTLAGGLFALHLRDRLHLILGFSAGAVIAVSFFDLLPEALDLAGKTYSLSSVMSVTALGFAVYLILDRFILLHGQDGHSADDENHRGIAGASSLSLHSFLDGIGIGLAFKVSLTVGMVVTVAVLAHDFSDGINTVNMILRHAGERSRAFTWLLVDAIAPVAGVVVTLFFSVAESYLGLLLALFAGFFLYIGASDLIPESQHAHPVRLTTAMTVLGMGLLYLIIHAASI